MAEQKRELTINIEEIYGITNGNAVKSKIKEYLSKVNQLIDKHNPSNVILTGKGPIWLYLKVAHELHGKVIRLYYKSPNAKTKDSDDVEIFNHSAE